MKNCDIQIVIPMSGFGERFRHAGYKVPKPLIEVDGKPIVAHVVDLFEGEGDITFICNENHLAESSYQMEEILRKLCPSGRVVGIAPHRLGPVHAVQQVANLLDPLRPTIVNYCDFSCYWEWSDFIAFTQETGCAGAIPAYRGFHPHSLRSGYYAFIQEENGWVRDIKEKQPFTDDPMNEYASSGTYYFSNAELMLRACEAAMDQGLSVNGEYYTSLIYKPILADRLPVAVYELQHFKQWGTPADLEEYRRWSEAFAAMVGNPAPSVSTGTVLLPVAGAGRRFQEVGYQSPKPLIPVSGRPMVVQACADLPTATRHRFVLRRDLADLWSIVTALHENFPNADPVILDGLTDGQARTCLLGLDGIDLDQPLTIGACDNGVLFDQRLFSSLFEAEGADLLVWGIRGHAAARLHPEMFGWIDADDQKRIRRIVVKQPLSSPDVDPIVLGTFTFRHARDFVAAAERMIARGEMINGEYYVDTCVNDAVALGLDCRLFEVKHYFGWGTPDELNTFEYWQSCFHKSAGHPYRLDRDRHVTRQALTILEQRYATRQAPRPRMPAPVLSAQLSALS